MKISKETALAAMTGVVPANLDEYYAIGDFCAAGGPPMTVGRGKVFLALGRRLKTAGLDASTSDSVDISTLKGAITDDESFGASRVVLLNTSIVTTPGVYKLAPIAVDEARGICSASKEVISAIGHSATAEILTSVLGRPVAVNRFEYRQNVGDIAVVFKLRGRPPEGKILSQEEVDAIGFDFFTLRRLPEAETEAA